MRQVHGWGNPHARFILVGEAPGLHEEETGEPFVGASGWRLKDWWGRAGLKREDFYIDNVVQFRPPHNNIDAFETSYIQQWMSHLQQRITALPDPWILVPTGNYALYALTGKGKVKWHTHDGKEKRAGITDWRGSILEYTDLNGRKIKVVPTIHPAATFRQPDYEQVCIQDWLKIAHEGTFRETNLPKRTHETHPTLERVEEYLHSLKAGDVVAVDIENPKPKEPTNEKVVAPIVCLAFASRPDHSLTIPLTRSYWGDQATVERVWQGLAAALQRTDISWVFHNGLYDTFHLAWERNITVANYRFDTLYMHHCLAPSDWHSLDYCASRDTREPFWKHEAKDPEEAAQYSSNLEAFWVYNGKDACVTRELYDIYHGRLASQHRLEFYLAHYANLLAPLQALQLHGIKVDDTKRRLRLAHLMADCLELQDRLEVETGLKLYGKSSLSNTKLKHYLYDVLGLPKVERTRKERGEKTVTADELAVRRLMLKHKQPLAVSGPLILDHKRKSKLREFYDEGRVDADGYMRAAYSMNTEAGRLSSKSNPNGSGSNLQNQDREIRDMFIPDDRMVLIEVDGCFVGETLIETPYGSKPIRDMKIGDLVFSYKEKDVVIGHVSAAKCVGKRPIFKLTLDNGKSVMGTADHIFPVRHSTGNNRRGSRKKTWLQSTWLASLEAGNRLIPFRRKDDGHGYEVVYSYSAFNYLYTHQAVAEYTISPRPHGYDTHHKDGNKRNNRPSNLEYVKSHEHRSRHGRESLKLVDDSVRLTALRAACKERDFNGSNNPNYGKRRGWFVTCPSCERTFYTQPAQHRKFCSRRCYHKARNLNHKVVSVENLYEEREVYAIAVESEHNYALTAGVFTHNSQVEARIDYAMIFMLTGNKAMFEKAMMRPDEYDQHTENASVIFQVPTERVTKDQRYLGKKCVHGAFRDMQGKKLADELLKDGYVLDPAECGRYIEEFKKRVPGIDDLFRWCRRQVIEHRMCESSWGHRLYFTYDRFNDDLYRRAYSLYPQADCAGWMNVLGLVPFFWYIQDQSRREGKPVASINVHAHDALVFSVLPQYAYTVTKFLVDTLEQPWSVQPTHPNTIKDFRVPCEIKLGTSWKCSAEFKRLPPEQEFTDAVYSLQR